MCLIKTARKFPLIVVISAILLTLGYDITAYGSSSQNPDDLVKTRLILGSAELEINKPLTIAFKQTTKQGWHTYWKNPGDSGEPVEIKWNLPQEIKTSDIIFPEPVKIDYGALASYGYENNSILLQDIYAVQPLQGKEITLDAKISTLVCKEICIPVNETVSITLNNAKNYGKDYVVNKDFVKASQNKSPIVVDWRSNVFTDSNDLITEIYLPDTHLKHIKQDTIAMHPIDWGVINNISDNEFELSDDKLTVKRKKGARSLSNLDNYNFLLAFDGKDGERHVMELSASKIDKANITNMTTQKENQDFSIMTILLFALLGGLILNLMPCVFPILSMKALSIAKMSGENHTKALSHGFAYTIGVLISFVSLGVTLILLRQAGESIGWGFQLQNPIIVTLLAWLLFVIGLNLAGVFEFSFNALSGAGSKVTSGGGISTSFFTGILATIVAAPCTAPFMGTAIGYAITQPAFVTIPVFAMLGLGLALPFLIISIFPATSKILPKPGAWMDSFKQLLSFPIFASAVWLVWVLSRQAGSEGVVISLSGIVAIYFLIWINGLSAKSNGFKIFRKSLSLGVVFLILLSLFTIGSDTKKRQSDYIENGLKSISQSWSPDKMNELLDGDDPLFVEMTASWCITCKINEKIALNNQRVITFFKQTGINYLVGDWTNKDSDITKYLETHGRNGVPLYVYYGQRNSQSGKRPEPIILPQILTPSMVIDNIKNTQ